MAEELRLSWTNWPSWFPRKELGALDLRGLEHFLLSRSQILDEEAFGVDFVENYEQSFGATWSPDTRVWSITVRNLRAVTPNGEPVCLNHEPVTQDIEEGRDSESRPVFVENTNIDLWLEVTNAEPTNSSGGRNTGPTVNSRTSRSP